jgi:hypothetical protein
MNHYRHNTLTALSSSLLVVTSLTLFACSDDVGGELGRAGLNQGSGEPSDGDRQTLGPIDSSTTIDEASSDGDATLTLTPVEGGGSQDVSDAGVGQASSDDDGTISIGGDGSTTTLTPSGNGNGGSTTITTGGDDDPLIFAPDGDEATSAGGPVIAGAGEPDAGGNAGSIVVRSANGSGCAGQKATVTSVAADLSSFTIHIDGYETELGDDISKSRLNCLFMIDIEPPLGKTYAVTAASMSGEANLLAGATARAMNSYFYQGSGDVTSEFVERIPGGRGAWSTDGVFAPEQVQFAPCQDPLLLLNTSVALSGSRQAGVSTVSVDGDITVKLALAACE